MKKRTKIVSTVFSVILLLISKSISAQVSSIRTWTATAPEINPNTLITRSLSDVKLTTQYFDGLGRPIQTVDKLGSLETSSGANKDIVTPIVYDQMGRQAVKYLAYVSPGTDGSFKTTALTEQNTFYSTAGNSNPINGQGETFFYGQTNYEASPLNRPVKSMAAGNNWVGSSRGAEIGYWFNTGTDDVKIWDVTNSSTVGVFGTYALGTTVYTTGVYPVGALYKKITTDESGKQTIEFKDKDGLIILKKVQLTATADNGTTGSGYTGWICTYYIYDDLGNLRAVIQPEGVKTLAGNGWLFTTAILNEQCFRYEYDARLRPIMKKVPGVPETYFVYDTRDRLVMTQDGNLRNGSPVKWQVTVYDNFDRAIQTGLLTDGTSFATHLLNAYNSSAYPSTALNYELLTQTHYDDYSSLPVGLSAVLSSAGGWSSEFGATNNTTFPYPQMPVQGSTTSTKGVVTWTQVKIIGSSPAAYLSTVNIYDQYGRVIQTQTQTINGIDISTTQYSWFGNPLIKVESQQKTSGANLQTTVVISILSYDVLGRLTQTQKKIKNTLINSNAFSTVVATSVLRYDVLGHLREKELGKRRDAGGIPTSTPLELQKFDYNIRDWLLGVNRSYLQDVTSVNNAVGTGEQFTYGTAYPAAGTFFGYDLGYDKNGIAIGPSANAYSPQYNGNIAGTTWKSAHDGQIRKYSYTYDLANRLTGADFNQYTNNVFSKAMAIDYSVTVSGYDYNGNIGAMTQMGLVAGTMQMVDNLTYTPRPGSNQLAKVSDAAPVNTSYKLGDFQNGVNTGDDYAYDNNGNVTSDLNRGISSIQYNYLNLPQVITITGKGTITYLYDAAGNKLQKTTVDNTITPTKTTITAYVNGKTYINDVLQFINHEEGRIRFAGSTGYVFDYFLKDHLGNTRMVITDDQTLATSILEASSYYPFGLAHSGINKKAAGNLDNKYQYLGKEKQSGEFNDGTGLEEYDLGARFYDPQIGRFFTVDPLCEYMRRWTPYHYSYDNPILYSDANGMEPWQTMPDVILAAHKVISHSWWDPVTILSKAADFLPFVGSIKQIVTGIYDGDWKEITMGVAFLAVDVFTAGEGGALLHAGEAALEDGIKVVVESEIKEGAEKAIAQNLEREGAEGIEKQIAKNCGCFLAGTLILTDSGYKKIEDIKIGNIVWAYNDTTHTYGKKMVINIFEHVRDTVYQLHIGTGIIKTTSDHPFFIAGRWLKVKDLHVGDSVTNYVGKKLVISAIDIIVQRTTVHNFEVQDYHTYYVSEQQVLVHNNGACDVKFGNLKDHAKRHGEGLDANAYKADAIKNIKESKGIKVTHNGTTKKAFITKVSDNAYKFTSTSLSGRRIFTHMKVDGNYLSRKGITLPK